MLLVLVSGVCLRDIELCSSVRASCELCCCTALIGFIVKFVDFCEEYFIAFLHFLMCEDFFFNNREVEIVDIFYNMVIL